MSKKNEINNSSSSRKSTQIAADKRSRFKRNRADTVFIFDPKVHMDLSESDKKNLADIEHYENLEWFVEVSKLFPGRTFGELALIRHETRAATIHCLCNCYFATLNKADF